MKVIASPYTKIFWNEYQIDKNRIDYNIVIDQVISGDLDIKKLSLSLQNIVNNFILLNSHLSEIDNILYWKKNKDTSELCIFEDTENQAQFVVKAFNLEDGPLYRFGLFKIQETKYNLVIILHHAIIDGSSGDEFFSLVSKYYNSIEMQKECEIKQIEAIQNVNKKLNDKLDYIRNNNAKHFWQKALNGFHSKNNIPYFKSDNSSMGEYNFRISKNILDFKIIKHFKTTTFTFLLSTFGFLISKYCNSDSAYIAYPVSIKEATRFMFGGQVNTIVLPIKIKSNSTLRTLIESSNSHIKSYKLDSVHRHSYLPINEIISNSDISDLNISFAQTNLNDTKFIFNKCNVEINRRYNKDIAGSDLILEYGEDKQFFNFRIKYNQAILNQSIIKQIANEFSFLLESFLDIEKVERKLLDISLLTKNEYQQIIIDWNKNYKKYPSDKTIYELFQDQAAKTPNNVAAIFEDKQITYFELNEKSNQLAKYILDNVTIKSNPFIALCMNKNLTVLISIFGIMKAGGIYVPIDPEYPDERISHILSDTQTQLLLTETCLNHKIERIKQHSEIDINFMNLDTSSYKGYKTTNLPVQNKPENIAYIIYTSGTTGKPKGVCIPHKGLNNLVINQIDKFNIKAKDNVLLFASLNFDASISEIFTSLISGACLNIISEESRKSSELFISYLEKNNINIMTVPPVLLGTLKYKKLDFLKTIVVAGETCPDHIMKKWSKNRTLINAYGPTENTVFSTTHEYKLGDSNTNIGKPVDNVSYYVLDKNNQPVPIGVIGELHVGGANLATGYLNRNELSQEKFIINPYATAEDIKNGFKHIYKTGDLVKLLSDGDLEYVGRNDNQVKIRGYRIELDEIENALSLIDGIKQACVLVKENNNNKYLISYIVTENNDSIDHGVIVTLLSKQLPDYMVPNVFIQLDKFPVTINGKLDRKLLPNHEFTNEENYIAPRTPLETILCNAWQEVLNLKKIGITDDFFKIGGDSILSIQLISKLKNQALECSVRNVFDCRTIQKLASFIESDTPKIKIEAEQGVLTGKFKLLPIQQWFFTKSNNNLFKKPNHWNQSFMVNVPQLEVSKLQIVIQKLSEQHDMLRTVYNKNFTNDQEYLATTDVPKIGYFNIKSLKYTKENQKQILNDKLTEWQSNFDINTGPMWHVAYIEGYEDQKARLFFAFHHLIIDAVSWRILIEDFKSLYNGETLTHKTSSYRQWVNEVAIYAKKNSQEKYYWNNLLKSFPKPQEIKNKTPSISKIQISQKLTSELIEQANKAYHTEINDLLLTSLTLSLKELNKGKYQAVTLESHGREHINNTLDNSKTIGWFTTMYPVKLELQKDLTSSIKHIKESLRLIPNKGIGFGAIFPHELINLPQISFNYLGQFVSQEENWNITSEYSGLSMHKDNIDTNIININGMVISGQLYFEISSKLSDKEAQGFAHSFKTNLEKVILHCREAIKKNNTQYTLSDFSFPIKQQALDHIQNKAKLNHNQVTSIRHSAPKQIFF